MSAVPGPAERFQAARAAFAASDLPRAETLLRELLAQAPAEANAHLLLGETLLAQSRVGEALAAYASAAALFPGLGLPFTRLATLALRASVAPVAPRERDPSRQRLQMTTLGARGRFGNQLLQYGYVRLYADRHQLELEVPDWIGRDLYGFDDPWPVGAFAPLDESQADLGAILRGASSISLAGRDVRGYFCWDTSGWGEAGEAFRALFRLRPPFAEPLAAAEARLMAGATTLVALHLRRGDFGQGRFWEAPVAWYRDWLAELWPRLERPRLYLATDAPELAGEFSAYAPHTARELGVEFPGVEFLADHYFLTRARHLAISNSSFSYSAAMLNGALESAVRPDPRARRLAPFAPWRAPVLLDAPRAPEALSPAERAVLARVLARISGVIYVGEVLAPWTNEVRAALPRLRVLEMGSQESLDALRARLRIAHVEHLRLGSPRDLGRLLDGATATLAHARLDCIEFSSGAAPGIGRELARALAAGFRLFEARPDGLRLLPDGRIHEAGTYLLLSGRLGQPRPPAGEGLLPVGPLARAHGVELRGHGVVHVGAHEGQEAAGYLAEGLGPVVLIEANPEVYARLARVMAGREGLVCIERAVSDVAGRVPLFLASFDQSSSLLPLAAHLAVYPDVRPVGRIEVEATPLDALLAEHGLDPSAFALLHIDVQGAELKVLAGAEALLGKVALVSLEVNFAELYQGCAQIEQIHDFLSARGFRRIALSSAYHPTWGDALYLREALPAA
jgi:FkbM family methyltransferase